MKFDSRFNYKNTIIFSILILSILYFFAGVADNAALLSHIARENPCLYGFRQLLSIIIVFSLGYIYLNLINGINERWHLLLSFPAGMVIWVVISYVELIVGIHYTLWGTLALAYGLLAAAHLVLKKRIKGIIQERNIFIILLSAAFVAASGMNYIFRSFDTFFFFTNYGHALSIWGTFDNFVGERVYVFNQIGQFFPILNSLASFLGLDQGFQMMVFAGYNLLLIFAISMLEMLKKSTIHKEGMRKAFALTATILLVSSTSFIIGSRWILANMYCMLYIFIIMLLVAMQLEDHEGVSKSAAVIIIASLGAGLGILRKDGIIFMAFLVICIGAIRQFNKIELLEMFLPAAVTEGLWILFVKVILGTRDPGRQVRYGSTTIASNKNVLFIVAIIVAVILYILIGRDILLFIEKKTKYITQYWIMLAFLVMLIIPCIKKKGWLIFDNFDYTVRNLFGKDSAWGLSAYILVAILVLSMLSGVRLDFGNFVWIGYAVLNFVSYSIIDDKVLWVNWDDSYSRVLMQIIPICLWVCCMHIWNDVIVRENKVKE